MADIEVLGRLNTLSQAVHFVEFRLPCGFPSPAADYEGELVDLNRLLLRHPDASFLARAAGESMRGVGIHDGDVLAVDRSMQPEDGDIVVACVEGEHTVKRLRKQAGRAVLEAANAAYAPIVVRNAEDLIIWGVVVAVLHPLVGAGRRGLAYSQGHRAPRARDLSPQPPLQKRGGAGR